MVLVYGCEGVGDRGEATKRNHCRKQSLPVIFAGIQFLGDIGDIGGSVSSATQAVDRTLCHGAAMDELDFGAFAEDLGGRVFAVFGRKTTIETVAGLRGAHFGLENLAVDVNALRQNAQRADFDPDQTAISVGVGSALILAVFVGVEGELLREAGVDAGLCHFAEFGAGNALANDEGEVLPVLRGVGIGGHSGGGLGFGAHIFFSFSKGDKRGVC